MAEETTNSSYDESEDSPRVVRPGMRVMGRSNGGGSASKSRRKVCRFCADKTLVIDYKNPQLLRNFITERGKLIPSRITGNCAKHQRKLADQVKRSRQIALMPFTAEFK